MPTRKTFIRTASLATAALAFAHNRLWAAGYKPQDYTVKMITDTVGYFMERGGTILFMLSPGANVVVDTQFPESAQHFIDYAKQKNQAGFEWLINTHHHGDHSSGNIAFKGIIKNSIAHKNSKLNQQRVAKERNTEAQQLYPEQVFETTWQQNAGDETIELRYYGPAHTNGDALVYFKNTGVVHLGDLLFNRRHPFIDKTAGASIINWIIVLDKALTEFPGTTKFICGHAEEGYEVLVTQSDIRAFQNYLNKLLQFVGNELKAGKSKEEILKATVIPGAEEWKAGGIERPLSAAITELTEEAK